MALVQRHVLLRLLLPTNFLDNAKSDEVVADEAATFRFMLSILVDFN